MKKEKNSTSESSHSKHIESLVSVLNKENFKYDDLLSDIDLTFAWRSVFDYLGHEWTFLNDEDRVEILRTLVKHGIKLEMFIKVYQMSYLDSNRGDIADAVLGSLAKIMKSILL